MPRKPETKVLGLPALKRALAGLRKKGKRIVFTNGCFDILHLGHVRYLDRARRLGDALVVAINSDASVRRIKGKGRPVNGHRDRSQVVAALESVDFVTLFSQPTPLKLIQALRPDVLVKGGDYRIKDIVGHGSVLSRGGRVTTIALTPGRGTTVLLKKIRSL